MSLGLPAPQIQQLGERVVSFITRYSIILDEVRALGSSLAGRG